VCPFNSSHQIPRKGYEKHVKRCELKLAGITLNLSESPKQSLVFYQKAPNVVSLLAAPLPGPASTKTPTGENIIKYVREHSAAASTLVFSFDGNRVFG